MLSPTDLQDRLDSILDDPDEEAALRFIVALDEHLRDPHASAIPSLDGLSADATQAAEELVAYIHVDGPQLADEIRSYLWDAEDIGPRMAEVAERMRTEG